LCLFIADKKVQRESEGVRQKKYSKLLGTFEFVNKIKKCHRDLISLLIKVVAGNHENEENDEIRPQEPDGIVARFHPQYEHYESRYNMPRNFDGHNTSQFYQ
jgi:hypothetical protein